MDIKDFEDFVFNQSATPMDHYDNEYFEDEWRSGGNSYDIEVRRSIEGRNPSLIREVFKPSRVIDMGCGPGALIYFLRELGVDCDGVDGSPHVIAMAPEVIRDKIKTSLVTDTDLPDNSYDLVISREVLEHLTVLELRKAICEMCRVSSRFIYMTTRYHPDPASLLDITTEFDVDPTHITCMNKDLVRLLFLLEGFRSRPDLELEMDWLNKGRVMVFEAS